jgi:hypothetical protein
MVKFVAVLGLIVSVLSLRAQGVTNSESDELLDKLLRHSALTYDSRPFHAVMEITPETTEKHPSPGEHYRGRVEVWWQSSGDYRFAASSPDFTLERVVEGGKTRERYTGDFFPNWLETFVRILVDPVPVNLFRAGAGGRLTGGPTGDGFFLQRCFDRDDRMNGITNDLTWGHLCVDQQATRIESLTTLNFSYYPKDWSDFDGKTIPRTYDVFVLDRLHVVGRLKVLEKLDATAVLPSKIANDSRIQEPIHTEFVSTRVEEGLLEKAPQIQWPAIREGKTDGYMIVYARTDRNGQVRESSPHNSDNPGLEAFGAEQALRYKFKPYLVDGVAVQTEMPLVLHFTSRIDHPIPVLTLAQMKKQTISCHPELIRSGVLKPWEHAVVRVGVDEKGSVVDSQPSSSAPWGLLVRSWESVKQCRFRPYLVDNKPTFYRGDVELPAW